MDNTLLGIVIRDIAVPEIFAIIARLRGAGNPEPTLAEVQAELDNMLATITQSGMDYLDKYRT